MSPGNIHREVIVLSDPSIYRWWNELKARPALKQLNMEGQKYMAERASK
jgi:hypothetical protein